MLVVIFSSKKKKHVLDNPAHYWRQPLSVKEQYTRAILNGWVVTHFWHVNLPSVFNKQWLE